MAYQVFITHMRQDSDLALDLTHRLQEVGVDAFLDVRDVPWGKGSFAEFERHLKESDAVIVLVTKNSINNPRLMLEMGAAFGQHKHVIPIVVGVSNEELPPMFKSLEYVRYADVNRSITELRERAESKKVRA